MSTESTKSKTEIKENAVVSINGAEAEERSTTGGQRTVNEEEGSYTQTHRGLKSRHIQLIALGGCIGTGLFVGTGSTMSLAGPAPLVLCGYLLGLVD